MKTKYKLSPEDIAAIEEILSKGKFGLERIRTQWFWKLIEPLWQKIN